MPAMWRKVEEMCVFPAVSVTKKGLESRDSFFLLGSEKADFPRFSELETFQVDDAGFFLSVLPPLSP